MPADLCMKPVGLTACHRFCVGRRHLCCFAIPRNWNRTMRRIECDFDYLFCFLSSTFTAPLGHSRLKCWALLMALTHFSRSRSLLVYKSAHFFLFNQLLNAFAVFHTQLALSFARRCSAGILAISTSNCALRIHFVIVEYIFINARFNANRRAQRNANITKIAWASCEKKRPILQYRRRPGQILTRSLTSLLEIFCKLNCKWKMRLAAIFIDLKTSQLGFFSNYSDSWLWKVLARARCIYRMYINSQLEFAFMLLLLWCSWLNLWKRTVNSRQSNFSLQRQINVKIHCTSARLQNDSQLHLNGWSFIDVQCI